MVSKLTVTLAVVFVIVGVLCNVEALRRRRRRRAPPPDTRRRSTPPYPARRRYTGPSPEFTNNLISEIIAEMIGATFQEVLARCIDAVMEAGNPDDLTEEDIEELVEAQWEGPMYAASAQAASIGAPCCC